MKRVILCANTDWYLFNFRLALANYLRRQGLEVLLVSPPGPYVAELQAQGFRWLSWRVSRKNTLPWQELNSLWALVRLYRRERPDLVHHHTIKPVLYGSLAARLAGVPLLVNSITGRGYLFLGEDPRARRLRRLVQPVYRLALTGGAGTLAAVIFENSSDRSYFITNHLAPETRTWLIEGVGVDPKRFVPAPEPGGPPLVVLAARMLWDKGVGVLVEAAQILKTRHPQARFALVGIPDPGNPASIPVETLQAWDKQGFVEWWGWRGNMPEVYAQSHIVALPTTYGEGVPTTLLEAAACARPLVVSDTPGCDKVVLEGQNGFRVPPNDPQALVQALERLLVDPALRLEMGRASRVLIEQKFTHDQVNAATFHVYQELEGQAAPGKQNPGDTARNPHTGS